VVLCIRWYLSFKLSYRDLVFMMNERGICLAHTTIVRWVQHYTPEFAKRWRRYARAIGGSWQIPDSLCRVIAHSCHLISIVKHVRRRRPRRNPAVAAYSAVSIWFVTKIAGPPSRIPRRGCFLPYKTTTEAELLPVATQKVSVSLRFVYEF
jgi:hypothetical protein